MFILIGACAVRAAVPNLLEMLSWTKAETDTLLHILLMNAYMEQMQRGDQKHNMRLMA